MLQWIGITGPDILVISSLAKGFGKVVAYPILGGLYHEYRLKFKAIWIFADYRCVNV